MGVRAEFPKCLGGNTHAGGDSNCDANIHTGQYPDADARGYTYGYGYAYAGQFTDSNIDSNAAAGFCDYDSV